jgi:hypothetical protein
LRKILLILCFAAGVSNGFAESVYSLDKTRDSVIGVVSAGLSVSSLFIKYSAGNAHIDGDLERNSVNAFDRALMFPYNRPLSIVSDVAAYSFAVLPLLPLAWNVRDGRVWGTYGVMYAEALLLVFGTANWLKNTVVRYRPYNYFGEIPSAGEKDYFESFPSQHTAFAFMSAGFFTSTFFAEYPDSPWKVPFCAAAYTMASAIALSRIFSGNHFTSDVLAGAVIGSAYGYLVPWLHLRPKPGPVSVTLLPNSLLVTCAF